MFEPDIKIVSKHQLIWVAVILKARSIDQFCDIDPGPLESVSEGRLNPERVSRDTGR